MLVAYALSLCAFFKTAKFSNLTFGNEKNPFTNFRSSTNLKPPLLFGTKNDLDTYYYYFDGLGIYFIAPEDR